MWPNASNEVPKSCCKEPENSEKCLTQLDNHPFPSSASNFIKTDVGCIDEINSHVRKNIRDTWIYMIIICILYGFCQIFYAVQYYYDYYGRDYDADLEADAAAAASGPTPGFFTRAFWNRKRAQGDNDGVIPDGGDLYDVNGKKAKIYLIFFIANI